MVKDARTGVKINIGTAQAFMRRLIGNAATKKELLRNAVNVEERNLVVVETEN